MTGEASAVSAPGTAGPGGDGGLRMRGISKRFPGVLALDDATFDVQHGEVHALVGKNGAGKSTLMGILNGNLRPDAGEILLGGRATVIADPLVARKLGLGMVHQEFALCPNLTVAENVFLGNEPRNRWQVVDYAKMNAETARLLARIHVSLDPTMPVELLGVPEWQVIEICKALASDPRFIIMDEPTAALGEHRIKDLLDIIRRLRESGHGIVYISHKLSEVLEIADRITVLRDGRIAATLDNRGIAESDLVSAMIGTSLERTYSHDDRKVIGEAVLEVEGLSLEDRYADVGFALRRGEVLGLTGLLGSGCNDVLRSLFGIEPPESGVMRFKGTEIAVAAPGDAVRCGIGYVPADRKQEGLVLELSVSDNAVMTIIDRLTRLGLFSAAGMRRISGELVEQLDIKVGDPGAAVQNLSGGNQQKVSIAKWLAKDCEVLLFEEPTRGVDINAKAQIWQVIDGLAAAGTAVLVVSSELPELLEACDRILVMRRGRLVDALERSAFDETRISMKSGAEV